MAEQKEVHIVKKIDAAIKNEICTEMLRCMLKGGLSWDGIRKK